MKRFLFLALAIFLTISNQAQTGIPRAQAMFIYNFSRLIEWPASYKSGEFIIGVLGSAATLSELNSYTSGKMVGSQKIVVKKFNSSADITKCHILFVPFSKSKTISQLSASLGSQSTLIISEKNGSCEAGAALNFLVIGDKLKFEIKPTNATNKSIKLSSKLSEMAYKIY